MPRSTQSTSSVAVARQPPRRWARRQHRARHRSAPIVVVVSALAGVTDALLDIATRTAQRGGRRPCAEAPALRPRPFHRREAQKVDQPRGQTFAELRAAEDDGGRDGLPPGAGAYERPLVRAALNRPGCPARTSPRGFIINRRHLSATPRQFWRARKRRPQTLGRHLARGVVAVSSRSLGDPDGQITTLGRWVGLTATLLARASRRVKCPWKTAGVLTAIPGSCLMRACAASCTWPKRPNWPITGEVLHPRALISRQRTSRSGSRFAQPRSTGLRPRSRSVARSGRSVRPSRPFPPGVTTVTARYARCPGRRAHVPAVQHAGSPSRSSSQASSEQLDRFSVPMQRRAARQERARRSARIARGKSTASRCGRASGRSPSWDSMAANPASPRARFSALADAASTSWRSRQVVE